MNVKLEASEIMMIKNMPTDLKTIDCCHHFAIR